nr:amino acid adenylation domain-containing protein [Deinococcus betulae]
MTPWPDEQARAFAAQVTPPAQPRTWPARLEDQFAVHVARAPHRPAVTDGTVTLTYRQLDDAANAVARRLQAAGDICGQNVLIVTERHPLMVVALLGCLKAGACFVPVDARYPAERVAFMRRDAGAVQVITTGEAAEGLLLDLRALDDLGPVHRLGDADLFGHGAPLPPAGAGAAKAACLMYTSGTTGTPKGVPVPHGGIARLVHPPTFRTLGPNARVLQAGAVAFDASTFEIWAALLHGGCLQIAPRDTLLDAPALAAFLTRHGTTTALITAALFAQLAAHDPRTFQGVRELLVGGDVLPAGPAQAVLAACPDLRLLNAYGPTENSVISTLYPVTAGESGAAPIGRPIPGSTAMVCNPYGHPLPPGYVGELVVGGEGVATGYHGRPALTQEKFLPDPWRPDGRLYRTGDLARWRPDGQLEYLGRRDQQVKVRGFRVEPGEIEQALRACEGVTDAVVVARTRPHTQEVYLHGYLSGEVTVPAVQAALAQALPPHMVPARLTRLAQLPMTVNGKVDRRALPADEVTEDAPLARDLAPALLQAWSRALDAPQLQPHDDLLALGASSLTAALVSAQVEHATGRRCPAGWLFGSPSVAALIARTDAAGTHPPLKVPDVPVQARYPATAQQRRVYIEQVKEPGSAAYNLPLEVRLPGVVDPDRLLAAWQSLVDEHAILRTHFRHGDAETTQEVVPRLEARWTPLPDGAPDPLGALVAPFNPHEAPLWRIAVRPGADHTLVALDIHHLLTDGHALALLLSQWARRVAEPGTGSASVDAAYGRYATWQRSPAGAAHTSAQGAFWTELYRDAPAGADLPTDRPRPLLRDTQGATFNVDLGETRTRQVRALARQARVSTFHVLLAAYSHWLAAVTGQPDVRVGTPFAGRHLPGFDAAQGMFVNTLPLRLRPAPDLTFTAHLQEVACAALAATEHQDYPFEQLVQELGAPGTQRHPVFDSMFALQNTALHRTDVLGTTPAWRPETTGRTLFDLNVQVEDHPHQLTAAWTYATALFDLPTVKAFSALYLRLLDEALARPLAPLGDLLVSPEAAASPSLSLDFAL